METDRTRPSPRSWKAGTIVLTIIALLIAIAVPATAGGRRHARTDRADIAEQGGDGVVAPNGARLTRTRYSLTVQWRMPTPRPRSYDYPTADQIPDGAPPHPPVRPGKREVFTLWAFVFNHPDRCTDPCDFDDIGDTPAQGGVYQLDGIVTSGRRIHMHGKIRRNQPPAAGAMLRRPKRADVHVALAPHGRARRGDRLGRQLNGAIGTPAFWWPAIFEAR